MELRDKNGLSESEFLARYSDNKYPKPSLTADIAVFAKNNDKDCVLLIRRGGHPYLGCWAFPGGFANRDESIEQTAARELAEETGIADVCLREVGMFTSPQRDPRGWVVSDAFVAGVDANKCRFCANDDADDAAWFDVNKCDNTVTLTSVVKGIVIKFSFVSESSGFSISHLSKDRLAFDHAEMFLRTYNAYKETEMKKNV